MKVDDLLKELEGDNPIQALNEFNESLEESSDPQGIIHGLLLASRRCDNLLELLLAEKRTHADLATIFTTFSHILLNIAGELSEFSYVGLHITQQLLHNHEASIYKLTGSSNTNRASKSVLRCLTGMVMIGGEAASEVLATVDWGKVNINLIANRQSMRDVYDVRAWCIYLILAFLNSDEPNITKQFLHKKDLLSAIFPGLVWDPCERVINVLKVMHESVLLNSGVTKTMKIDIFTPATTKHLLELYKWLGPIGKLAKGGDLEDLESDLAKEVQSDRAQIKAVLHEFLLTLCTSTAHGIIFKEKVQGGSIKSNNWYVYKILLNLNTPWDSPQESELMSSFLGKCPDLLKTYLPTLKSSLKPRPTRAFVSLMDMVSHIIDNQKPWMKLETHGLEGAISCITPQPLVHPYIKDLLESCHSLVRFSGITLVLSILSKTKETVETIKSSKELSQEVKQHHQEKIMKMVFKVLRSEPLICCWEIAAGLKPTDATEMELSSAEHLEQPHKVTELLTIAKALTLYNELQPKEPLLEVLDPLKMLSVIQMLPENQGDTSGNSKAKIELQVLCLELLAHSKQSMEIVIDNSDNSVTVNDYNVLIKENILYKLISTYTHSRKEGAMNEDEAVSILLTEKCFKILSSALAKVGLPAHYDGSVKFWLRHITHEGETKLVTFLTRVIQKTVSSLHHYTDVLIKITCNLKEHLSEELGNPFIDSLETLEIEDNQEVSTLSVSLPFSRLILAAVDLLEEESDPDCIEYFSRVINDYQFSVNDPELLTTFLLQNYRVMTPNLLEYLKSWCRESAGDLHDVPVLGESPSLSEVLQYLFMTNDVSSVERFLDRDKLKEIISSSDLDLVVSQLLLYIHLKSDVEKNKRKVQKKYLDFLTNIYQLLEDSDPDKARQVLRDVLDHPRVLAAYHPFSSKTSPVTELVQSFVAAVLQKHPELASKTVPYFDSIMKSLEIHLSRNDMAGYWEPLSPFITSSHTVMSFEAAEQILTVCLKTSSSNSNTLEKVLIEVLKLVLKTTSAKRKLKEDSVQLLFSKFLEWGGVKEVSAAQQSIVQHMEKLLIQVLSRAAIEQLTTGDLKSLVRCQLPCPELCCHIVRQHPQHGHTFAKTLKKHRAVLPHQAPLLVQLLGHSDTAETAAGGVTKVLSEVKKWILDIDGEDNEISLLLPHAISLGLLDEDTLTEACHKLYEAVVTHKQPPPRKLMSLLPVYKVLAKGGPGASRVSLPEEHLSVLHICLSCIRTSYHKEDPNTSLLMNVAQLIHEVIPEIDDTSLRSSLTNKKLWSSFVKQVLRIGLTDPGLGPEMIHTLDLLSSVVYKKCGNSKEEVSVLPIVTFFQMVIAHSHYLTLMFSEEEEWETLKEKVVALQQTLVDCEESVCQESHVPVLLGAYGASMSTLDQRILKLLFTYEKKGFMTSYQPVLWSKAAIVHFGVKSNNVGFFRDPTPEQIFGLLNMDRILHTCYNFDTRLPLEPTDIHKADKTVYDIRFLLPLLLYLAEEENLSEIDYAESGAVVLGLIALTSHQQEVWGTGAAVLRCMVNKMEQSRHQRLSLPWFWLVGVVSCALSGRKRRLPALTTHFLIQATQLLSQPEHPMYNIVLNYVFLKPDFKLYFVPEQFRLYNSAHVTDSRKHRSFLLSILSSGIRQIMDYKISQRTFTGTLMMGMLQAPSADPELKVQVLQVLEAMVCIPLGAVDLVGNYSLLTVLSAVSSTDSHGLNSSKSSHLLLLSSIVRVLSTLWKTIYSTITKDVIVSDPPEEVLPEPEDDHAKRKMSPETSETSSKRMKLDLETPSDSGDTDEAMDEEIEKCDDYSVPPQKMLPPLFIHEFLNTLVLLLPAIIANSPPATLATCMELVSEVVQYVGKVTESSSKRQKIRLASLSPEVIKEQVFRRVQWGILHDHLQGSLSDDEEVKLLGSKSQDLLEKWRNEPLSIMLHQEDSPPEDDGETSCPGITGLKVAVFKLLDVLGR